MKVCVIGGANIDIFATSDGRFVSGDSNPGAVSLSLGGVGRNIAHNLRLLGDEVEFVGFFPSDNFGDMLEASCRGLGMGISACSRAPKGMNSCFVAINEADGELVGAVADMGASAGITLAWLSDRMDIISSCDVVVADANSPAESLAFLMDNCSIPLYIDAVSAAKAPRIAAAATLSKRKAFHALKCNSLEYQILAETLEAQVERWYVSIGSEGLKVIEDGRVQHFSALPCSVKNTSGGGDALFAGIIHCGAAPSPDCAAFGLRCAKCAVESEATVSEELKNLGSDSPMKNKPLSRENGGHKS